MSKIRTSTEFIDRLDEAFSWRLKEIADIKTTAIANSSLAQPTVIRAGIPLIYAHWEGFVKESSQLYLTFVASQRLRYDELASCFVVFGVKKHLSTLSNSKDPEANISVVNFFRQQLTSRSDLNLSTAIDTKSNLKSEVFSDIAKSLGITLSFYEPYFKLIDESLLARRNKIAHGEFLDIDKNQFRDLADEIIKLLRQYKTDLENLCITNAHRI